MKHITQITLLSVSLLAAGCTTSTTSGVPKGARVVGGGLKISWSPPERGTAVLIEQTTHKAVKTDSVDGSGSFEFDVAREEDADVLRAVFANSIPTNAQFVLYFVPAGK
jgi:hypothetical protein